MKSVKSPLKLVLASLALVIPGTFAMGQIHVVTNGNVGVGTTSPAAKLHVVRNNTNAFYTGYLYTDDVSTNTKYGLYNYLTSSGTGGSRYGTINYTYGNSASTSSLYGFYNYTNGYGYTVGSYNSSNTASSATSSHLGLYNYSYPATSGTGYGIYNYTYTPTSTNTSTRYGIYNYSYNYSNGTQYALYSSAYNGGTGTSYAGYFNGDVHVNGNLTWTSDARKKTNVANLSNALTLITQLEPKSYSFVEDANMSLPDGEQYGFLAQDLEKVLPSLVKTIQNPVAHTTENQMISEEDARNGVEPKEMTTGGTETEEIKSVNYVALIPILVQAVKDQQKEIEALKAELARK